MLADFDDFAAAVARWGDDADRRLIGSYAAITALPDGSLRLARSPWRWQFEATQIEPQDEAVALISEGLITPLAAAPAPNSAAAPDTESTPT